MTADELEETAEAGEPGESGGMSERTARLILTTILLLAIWGIVAAIPETAYVAVGVLLCLGWQRATGWLARRRQADEDEPTADEPAAPDIGAALRTLSGDGHHVLLTQLQKAVGAPDTKAVRALLKTAGIQVRGGVRAPAGNGPGVHRDDIPPAPPTESGDPSEGCCCRSGNNANANNDDGEGGEKGIRVRRTDGGFVFYDSADGHRHHRVDDH